MNFSYIAGIDDNDNTCPNSLKDPTTQLPLPCTLDFSHDYPAQADSIKTMALSSYKAAFANLPAIVAAKKQPNMLYGGSDGITSFEHTIYVRGDWLQPNQYPRIASQLTPPAGWTPFNTKDHSYVYYLPIMGSAQIELGHQMPGSQPYHYLRPNCNEPL